MKFCSTCGATVSLRVPDGDDRPRHVCDGCGAIHYRNPRIVTGCLVTHGEQILLCRRAIEPRLGYWTLPAGYLELGESSRDGAIRETWEEARANVEVDGLYAVFNLPHISQVYMIFRARLMDPAVAPGPESLEVRLFDAADLPWTQLAFPVMRDTLRYFLEDRRRNHYAVRVGDILFEPSRLRRRPPAAD